MKSKIVSTFFSLFVFASSAFPGSLNSAQVTEPPNLAGDYLWNLENPEVVQIKREVIIYSGTPKSESLVKEFRANGYACLNVDGRHIRCNKFLPKMQLIGMDLTDGLKQYDGKLVINEPIESAELVNDAPLISEWTIRQSAIWNGQKYTEMHFVFQKTTGENGLMKFKLLADNGQASHFYMSGEKIALQHLGSLKLEPESKVVMSDRLHYVLEIQFLKTN